MIGVFALVAALVLWAAVHSWLASTRMKDLAAGRFGSAGKRTYRLAYNLFAVLSFAPIAILFGSLPDRLLYRVEMPWVIGMLFGQAVSAVLVLLFLLQTGPLQFAGLSQILGRHDSSDLSTGGFYRWVRHPLYLFGLLLLWLTPYMTRNLLVVFAILTMYLFVGARLEERRLLREFGSKYEEYRARTPMIIPGLRFGPPVKDRRPE